LVPRCRYCAGLAVLFAFLAAFVRPAPASAGMPAGAGTRIGGFEVAADAWKFTTMNEGTSIIVRGGL
jgi:hypothetical protein